MLVGAVVIASNRTGTDIDVLADGGVAQIAQVAGFAALAQLGVLDLDKVSNPRAGSQFGPRAHTGEWPNVAGPAGPDPFQYTVCVHPCTGSQVTVFQYRTGPDGDTIPEGIDAFEDNVYIQTHIHSAGHLTANIHAVRIDDMNTLVHQAPGSLLAIALLQSRQLKPVIGALQVSCIRGQHPMNFLLLTVRHGKNIGQVILVLDVVAAQLIQPAAQLSSIGQDDPGVHFPDFPLRRGGVPILDDASDAPGPVTFNPAISARLFELHGQNAKRGQVLFHHFGQYASWYQWVVAQQHEHRSIIGNRRHGLHDGMARAPSLRLDHPINVETVTGLFHLVRTTANHHVNLLRVQRSCGLQEMRQHRPPADCLQHLRQAGLHA